MGSGITISLSIVYHTVARCHTTMVYYLWEYCDILCVSNTHTDNGYLILTGLPQAGPFDKRTRMTSEKNQHLHGDTSNISSR